MEKLSQPITPINRFVRRQLMYAMYAGLLVFVSVMVGTFGYFIIEKLSLIDSFHMASMILTGMGPVIEMKTFYGKLFSSFYALYSGVAFLSITAVFLAPMVHRLLHILHIDEKN